MYLDEILEYHRALAKDDHRDLDALIAEARAIGPIRSFKGAIVETSRDHLAVIAEIKRRSPSKGDLNVSLNPATIATSYEVGGASCLSVLTDEKYFGGSAQDLIVARMASRLPVIRKDFTISIADVCDTRLMGADCILLIAAALSIATLSELHQFSVELGLDVLVEVHSADELEHAVGIGASLIGVNQRNLSTFQVDHSRAQQLANIFPNGVVKVAESGVRNSEDATRLREFGYDAVLVGESLITSADISASIKGLLVQ
ncbi:MAG: indole-3-glycerol phosphate synthase TrpC [Ilumatobacteraceae bacterium]